MYLLSSTRSGRTFGSRYCLASQQRVVRNILSVTGIDYPFRGALGDLHYPVVSSETYRQLAPTEIGRGGIGVLYNTIKSVAHQGAA